MNSNSTVTLSTHTHTHTHTHATHTRPMCAALLQIGDRVKVDTDSGCITKVGTKGYWIDYKDGHTEDEFNAFADVHLVQKDSPHCKS